MDLFKIEGSRTEQNEDVFLFATKVQQLDMRISLCVEGRKITGTFRGKACNEYSFDFDAKSFDFEGDSYDVKNAFEKVLQDSTIDTSEYEEDEDPIVYNEITRGIMTKSYANIQGANCAETKAKISAGEKFVMYNNLFYCELSQTYQEVFESAKLHDWG